MKELKVKQEKLETDNRLEALLNSTAF